MSDYYFDYINVILKNEIKDEVKEEISSEIKFNFNEIKEEISSEIKSSFDGLDNGVDSHYLTSSFEPDNSSEILEVLGHIEYHLYNQNQRLDLVETIFIESVSVILVLISFILAFKVGKSLISGWFSGL